MSDGSQHGRMLSEPHTLTDATQSESESANNCVNRAYHKIRINQNKLNQKLIQTKTTSSTNEHNQSSRVSSMDSIGLKNSGMSRNNAQLKGLTSKGKFSDVKDQNASIMRSIGY